jgi:hypothetical protein
VRLTIAGLLTLCFLAAPAVAQDRRLSRLEPAVAAEVWSIVTLARNNNLPAEPLIDRALEGASKGAPGQRIVAAVRALSRDLGNARAALGHGASEAEVAAGAAALRAGADASVLARLKSARADNAVTVALGVLADLIARGVPADTAARAVLALASAGAADAEMVALRRNVERDIRNGAPPAIAASLRSRGSPSTLPPASGGAPASATIGDRERATLPAARP